MSINTLLFSPKVSQFNQILFFSPKVSQWLLRNLPKLPHLLKKPPPRSSLILLLLIFLKISRREHLFSLKDLLLLQDSCMKILLRQLVVLMRFKIFFWWVGYFNLLLMLFLPTPHSLLSFFHLLLSVPSTLTMRIPTSLWDSNWEVEIISWLIKSLTLSLDLAKKNMLKNHLIGLVSPFGMKSYLLKLLPTWRAIPSLLISNLKLFGIFIASSLTPSMQELCQIR